MRVKIPFEFKGKFSHLPPVISFFPKLYTCNLFLPTLWRSFFKVVHPFSSSPFLPFLSSSFPNFFPHFSLFPFLLLPCSLFLTDLPISTSYPYSTAAKVMIDLYMFCTLWLTSCITFFLFWLTTYNTWTVTKLLICQKVSRNIPPLTKDESVNIFINWSSHPGILGMPFPTKACI